MRYLMLTVILVLSSLAFTSTAVSRINIDPNQITVSGMSAGAEMAHQLHIAYPDVFSGVGLIAGGPFGCAEGSLAIAMSRCLGKVQEDLPVAQFVEEIRSAVLAGKLGPSAALADDPVWVFHGKQDNSVAAGLSDAIVALYGNFMPSANIRYVNDVEAGHNFPTRANGSDCSVTAPPFIGNCDYDAAGELLQHLYGKLEKPTARFSGELAETVLPGADKAGLLKTAYLYVPAACTTEKSCKAHLVLHGCAQSSAQIGATFIEQSGYLPWAEANNIVLAFPQVAPSATNPLACWDWWGYTGASYRWRDALQMQVLTDWMRALSIP